MNERKNFSRIIKQFTEYGFEWGGSWTDRKDYQHFELPNDTISKFYS